MRNTIRSWRLGRVGAAAAPVWGVLLALMAVSAARAAGPGPGTPAGPGSSPSAKARPAPGRDDEAMAKAAPPAAAAAAPPEDVTPRSPVVSQQDPPETAAPEFEVTGFQLRGTRPWHRVDIGDFDVLRTAAGQRLLPLLRLLKVFRTEPKEEAGTLEFQVEGGPPTLLNVQARRIRLRGHESPVELVEAISDITTQREIYLPMETIAEIFAVRLEWNETEYAFMARVDRTLSMWKFQLPSMQDVTTLEDPLPERFGMALPPTEGLQFLELEMAARGIVLEDRQSPKDLTLGNFRETLWGACGGGLYRIRFTQPNLTLEREGWRDIEGDPFNVDWAEWVYRLPHAEIAFGDSAFGLSDLVYPYGRLTGVRINGIVGGPEDALRPGEPVPGLNSYFSQSYDFEGYARAGSHVQLLLNDRLIEEWDVVADSPSRPGQGAYRFEDIRLSPGVLNDVRIVIRDPDGIETQIQKTLVPTALLVPRGAVTYLAAVGTNRLRDRWEGGGTLAVGRATYGVTDTLAIGASAAYQQDFYAINLQDADTLLLAGRDYPVEAAHLGTTVTWKPVDILVLSAETAVGDHDDERTGLDDWATSLKADLYPVRDLHIGMRYFQYSPGFFNGQNLDLADREGWLVAGTWRLSPQWQLGATVGRVRNNTEGDLDDTLAVDFQHAEVTTSVIRPVKLTVAVDRTRPTSTGEAQVLYTVRGRSELPGDFSFLGEVMTGDFLLPEADPQFFSGISVPGMSLYEGPAASALLIKRLGYTQSLAGRYLRSGDRQRASLVHTYRTPGERSVQLRTEVGMDIYRRESVENVGMHNLFVESRIEYLTDLSGRNRFGILTRHEGDDWTVYLFANLSNRFAFPDGRPVRIANRRVYPDRGGVHGRVFLDYNGNGRLDEAEPGLSQVTVLLRSTLTTDTDKDGYYVLPGLRAEREARVSLDIDTVPAIYYPTNGTQMVEIRPRTLTRVDLGVAPAHSVTGVIRVEVPGGEPRALAGLRVMLADADSLALVADSVTAGDGSYYLGNVLAGRYILRIDALSLPAGLSPPDPLRTLDVPPDHEPVDMDLDPIVLKAPPPRET